MLPAMDGQPPLDDEAVFELLLRMAQELEGVEGSSLRGDTTLKSARAVLLTYLIALKSLDREEADR